VNEDEMYDAAEREMDLYRNEIECITSQRNRVSETADHLRALLDHETRLTWQSGLPGEQARVAPVREQAGLEALT
jgi:hypothetical protein